MKLKKISAKLLVVILPVIIVAMAILTIVSTVSSEDIINEKTGQTMTAELSGAIAEMNEQLNIIQTTSATLAKVVGTGYKENSIQVYEAMLRELVGGTDIAVGSGLWFEPYVYDANKKYVGPYIYKEGNELIYTEEYEAEDYDYLSRPYYTISQGKTEPVLTDPYYDEGLGKSLATSSVAIYDNGTYIGCASMGVSLETIVEIVNNIKVGENGTALLTTSSGVYLAGVAEDKIAAGSNITEDENKSLAAAGNVILNNDSGITTYKEGSETLNLYYATLPGTGWKLAIRMPQSELNAPVHKLTVLLGTVCTIAVILSVVAILIMVSSISQNIKKVQVFAGSLADGDFSIEPLHVKTADELGVMGNSLNEMYSSNKDVIQKIAGHATEIGNSSKKLSNASKELNRQFKDIQIYMKNVNEAMLNTSAATEEVNASTEEVLSNVNLLTNETADSMGMAKEIQTRASQIGEECRVSSASANKLSEQFEKNLSVSIKDADIVSNISEMANVISNIAEQINLLSLNASIEAARAGEAGRGFAVVASEIGNLAGSTTEAVGKIQETIEQVQKAFTSLIEDAKDILDFVQNTVTPDYDKFLNVANQYGEDANSFELSSAHISEMSNSIHRIMSEVTEAIQSIAESTQDTTEISQNIFNSINEVSGQVEDVDKMSADQEQISTDLDSVVKNFRF